VVRDPKVGSPATEADIKAHVKTYANKGTISKYGIPHRIVFVDGLPRTSVGKLDKKALRQKYDEGA
jgi:fatty-acyl-CoA synthase